MSTCLLCHNYFEEVDSWSTLFSLVEPDPLCSTCSEKFEKVDGELCEICGRSFSGLPDEYREGNLCYDCVRWENEPEWKGVLTKNRSLYLYNDFAKDVISLYKFRGDFAISSIFKTPLKKSFKTHFNSSYLVVSIPLSDERLYERGFNQAKAIAELLDVPIHEVLARTHLEKQSKKSRDERISGENVFRVVDIVQDKDILLVDDIYTTGSTLRHAGKVLIEAGAKSVSSLTLMRG
ncbi:ComF family protein [Bacillus timonensis]|uniref:ComF family protein n=1 Tax=Bacillus timonensis TaxID=1033734 RepID=A0A4S3PRM1_9BACI|nr:ComF family protein [Bacillus timonensis]THE12337.1 ComF family protein [Bacillus timonensis]